jgi:hypothetical protein
MGSLGMHQTERPRSEIRVGFRTGWIRALTVSLGGAGILGVAGAIIGLAEKQPEQMFGLLMHWGVIWLLVLVAMLLLWDLAKLGLAYLGSLAESVKETAVAMNRIADKDDRERDRLVTTTEFVGQRLLRLSTEHEEWRAEQRAHNSRMEQMLMGLSNKRGEETRDAAGRGS